MADVKWIKIVTDIFDDEKILIIESLPEADAIIVIWFKLLCLAGKQNNSGVFLLNNHIPYSDEMFAAIFRRNVATVRLALATFENLGMVEIINNAVTIPSWGKHQNFEGIENRKNYMRGYMRDYRERQKLIAEGQEPVNANVNVNKTGCKPDVSSPDIDIDKDIDKERDINNTSCAEPLVAKRSTLEEIPTPSEFNIILNDKTYYNVPKENIERYKELYPGVDVEQALRNMIGWCEANTERRKTRRGIKSFINTWLAKSQDKWTKGGGVGSDERSRGKWEVKQSSAGERIL